MKMCAKCHAEYPDDMAFCSYCGTPLQPKIEERVCPACGKTVHADNLRFCPYCGYSFTSLETKKPSNTKPPLPPDVNIKKNYVKMQPLNQEKKPTKTPLQANAQRNVCPSCKSVIYAKNLNTCPYCDAKLDFSKTPPPVTNAKPKINQPLQGNVCPACGKIIHANNINSCPYCGKSLKENSMGNSNQASLNVNNPLPSNVNIKKNYVKMQPLNQENKPSINEANKSVSTTESNESNSGNSESSSGGFLKSALTIIGVIFLMGFSKACGRILYHGTTGSQKGFFIGVVFAGIVGGIIPAIVANKYCKFDNPSTAVWLIFILQIIVSFLSAYQIVPIGSIPIGIILAILLYLFNKK